MTRISALALTAALLTGAFTAHAQVTLTGRLTSTLYPGSDQEFPMTAVNAFAAVEGDRHQAIAHKTFETHPVGWYFMHDGAGRYTLCFSNPAHYMRPLLATNIFTEPGLVLDKMRHPHFDFHNFYQGGWDEEAAAGYYQTFFADGTSITQVGFKLVHDGIDGQDPGSQNFLISIHESGGGTPDTWDQVGPTITVRNVDTGGAKSYWYSAGWNSGEVPTTPGKLYAVYLRPEQEGNTAQFHWRPDEEDTAQDVYRIASDGSGAWTQHDAWMAVSSDMDGLLIPYNKSVHKEYVEFAGFSPRWVQSYKAMGESLANVIVYGAASGTQPSQNTQRLLLRVREGGPEGEVVGTKILIGNANYTGDASWGTYGAAFAPGEIPVTPGQTYALDFSTIENDFTLGEFANIKGVPSDLNAGFNAYKRIRDYAGGRAWMGGTEVVDFDLDMQVIEYEHDVPDWDLAVHEDNLLENGDMEKGEFVADNPDSGKIAAWHEFQADPGTSLHYVEDSYHDSRAARVIGGSVSQQTVNGGWVQAVEGLQRTETYRILGDVRSSHPLDREHQVYVGYDTTGQTDNPGAESITWVPAAQLAGHFLPFVSEPIRPNDTRISVWLRAVTSTTDGRQFRVDFDNMGLHKVMTQAPRSDRLPVEVTTMEDFWAEF